MLTAGVVALGLLHGMPLIVAALTMVAVWNPLVAAACLVALSLLGPRSKRGNRQADDEARLLTAVAAELRGGATVRQALVDAAGRVPELELDSAVRLATSGMDGQGLGRSVAAQLPVTGYIVGPAIATAITSGGRAAVIFERLALRASDRAELDREVEIASAQARLSLKVLIALPVALLTLLAVSGHLGRLAAAGPFGLAALALGAALETAGIGVVMVLLRRVAP